MKFYFLKRNVQQLLTFFIATFICFQISAQTISLPKEWKFKMGDNLEWASPTFNDGSWGYKNVNNTWSAVGIKENVYSWYRISIFIPSSIRSTVEKRNGFKISLGKIDDADQTFFNGKLVGKTGSFPPDYETKYNVSRVYFIKPDLIQWDKENTIAVRVFSPDIGGVGMYGGPFNIGPIEWMDFILMQRSITATKTEGFVAAIDFSNNNNYAFDGEVKYAVVDENNATLFSQTKKVQIQPQKDFRQQIVFTEYKPKGRKILKIKYQVKEDNSSVSYTNEQLFLFKNEIDNIPAHETKPLVENKIKDVFSSVAFDQQKLSGYLGKRLTRNAEERLLKIDEKGIMEGYLQRPGSHPWIGEHVGKYLESACNVWRNTHDARMKKQMDRMMYELIQSQLPDGYLGTYIPDQYWTSWDLWSHKYNLSLLSEIIL
jgi:hypothetical protein